MFRLSSVSSSSAAVTASLALHVGVAGFALAHGSAPEPAADHWLDMEMLAAPTLAISELAPQPTAQATLAVAPVRRALASVAPQPRAASKPQPSAAAPSPSPPAAVPRFNLSAHDDAPVRFSLPVQRTAAGTLAALANAGSDSAADGGDETLPASAVSRPARLLVSPPVVYPAQARAAELEASVALEIVVDARGRVVQAQPLEHVGYGLDDAALQAVRSYIFAPAQRAGRPVRVRMRWNVLFRLR
jgi:periplasmic protein TonB